TLLLGPGDAQVRCSESQTAGPRPSQMPRPEPIAPSGAGLRPALVATPVQPTVELLLNRPLDDQPGTEPAELGQHLLQIVDQSSRQQLADVSLYLHRRRYRASHGR